MCESGSRMHITSHVGYMNIRVCARRSAIYALERQREIYLLASIMHSTLKLPVLPF